MADGDLGILLDSAIRIAQYSDEDYTLFAYDVTLDEQRRESSRARMDLSAATLVFEVEDPALVLVPGSPSAAFTFATPTVTLTDATATFTTALIGRFIEIINATSGGNDGVFLITGVPGATTLEYTNVNGVAEAQGLATYEINRAIIVKNSADSAQIEIDADQVTETPTSGKGTAILKLLGADTSATTPGGTYWQDAWVYVGGKKKRILKRSRFYVDDGAHEPSVGVPLPVLGAPAPQSQQDRSFKWTVPTTGSSWTVTLPGTGMLDSTYCIGHSYSFIPALGVWSPLYFPESSRTAADFLVESNVTLTAGTIIDFTSRDSQDVI